MPTATTATLHEIFSSRQGEGIFTGDWMTFVRFQGCALRCQWCDTPHALSHAATPTARIESPARSAEFVTQNNPITIAQLNTLLTEFPADDMLALTGGEPLEQAPFIAEWLRAAHPGKRTLLETGGVLTKALALVAPLLDVISMDLKLPSSTGMKAYWKEHADFLTVATQSPATTYVKIVVTAATSTADVDQGLMIIADTAPTTPVFLQIASATDTFGDVPAAPQIDEILTRWRARLPALQIGRQMHKVWNIL